MTYLPTQPWNVATLYRPCAPTNVHDKLPRVNVKLPIAQYGNTIATFSFSSSSSVNILLERKEKK